MPYNPTTDSRRLRRVADMYRRTALTAKLRGRTADYRVFMAAAVDARKLAAMFEGVRA